MAFSATLAYSRNLITEAEHCRILNLFSRAGLSVDHELFNEEILDKGTAAILKTRDGKLRAAVPHPIGSCTFINDANTDELHAVLRRHKELMKKYPRQGAGLEAYVDASDTGYTENNADEVEATAFAASKAGEMNGHMNGHLSGGDVSKKATNGIAKIGMNGTPHREAQSLDTDSRMTNGGKHINGHVNGMTNGIH